ncbi:MAG TPA: DUF5063 domain-containing protein [Actinomycetes bacterium]|nr:DUF5063 domain-containing protein [Actinomycetes bacterium]
MSDLTSGPGSGDASSGDAPLEDVPAVALEAGELSDFAREIAGHAATFLSGVAEVATGAAPETAISALIVQLAQVSMAGAMLGAVHDVVPVERFETDTGPDPDLDPLRESLAGLLEGIDDYAAVFDPLLSTEPTLGRISDDIADVAGDLSHGLRHYRGGRLDEALWWWQFSYLSSWGQQALSAQRALLSIVSHQRLDVDEESATAAEADALLRD